MTVIPVKVEAADVAKSAMTVYAFTRLVHHTYAVSSIAEVASSCTVVLIRMAVTLSQVLQ